MKKSCLYLTVVFFLSSLSLILLPVKVSAVELEQVVAQSQVGDKVQEIGRDQFYAYDGHCGSSTCPYPISAGSAGWTSKGFDDSSWTSAQDSFVTNYDSAQHWWCEVFPSNCHPFGVTQTVGPAGFVDSETLLFRRRYTIPAKAGYRVADVRLELWSDNNSWAYIDGAFVTGAGLSNLQTTTTSPNTPTTYSVSGLSITSSAISADGSITNLLAIQVSNDNQGNDNPIGVAYKVTAVYEGINDASCGAITPDSVIAGQPFTATVTMDNTGGNNWSDANNYHLGSQNPQDNFKWGFNRVNLPSDTAPGQSTTFSFQATAPNTTGPADFSWKMVQDGVEWFGDICSKSITITSLATGPPSIQGINVANSGGGEGSAVRTSGSQSDKGGSGFYNPMTITLNAAAGQNGDGTPAASTYYVVFYDKSTGQISSDFINSAKGKIANPVNGFLLAYDETKNRCGGLYCVFVSPMDKWIDISSFSQRGLPICNSNDIFANCDPSNTLYTVFPSSGKSWKVSLENLFGSKSMYTAAYVEDVNQLSAYTGGDINPTTQ